jgi:hypothetical protein
MNPRIPGNPQAMATLQVEQGVQDAVAIAKSVNVAFKPCLQGILPFSVDISVDHGNSPMGVSMPMTLSPAETMICVS